MSEASMFELELYMGITAAWYHEQRRLPHIDRPMRPYVLGTGFAKSVEESPRRIDVQHVTAICAVLVSSDVLLLDGLRPVLDTQGAGRAPKHRLDSLNAWWLPLRHRDGLGLHYWELANGILELRRLHRFERPPPLVYGRFAATGRGAQRTGVG